MGSRFCEDGSAKGRWVTGDSVYGADSALRRWLQAHGLGYVLAVTKAQRLGLARVEELSAELPATAWQRLSAGDGAKGPRRYDWTYLPYGSDAAPGWEKGLLIRRKIAEPGKLAFYLTHAAHGTALADLVRIAGTRWTIEACFPPRLRGRQGRGRARPVRGAVGSAAPDGPAGTATSPWRCWRTPISPCCARPWSGEEPRPDLAATLLPLTVPELRRLLWHLVWPRSPDHAAALAWSHWRRHHQQRARRCHWQRRTRHELRL